MEFQIVTDMRKMQFWYALIAFMNLGTNANL